MPLLGVPGSGEQGTRVWGLGPRGRLQRDARPAVQRMRPCQGTDESGPAAARRHGPSSPEAARICELRGNDLRIDENSLEQLRLWFFH